MESRDAGIRGAKDRGHRVNKMQWTLIRKCDGN